jgi:hypothetical protein
MPPVQLEPRLADVPLRAPGGERGAPRPPGHPVPVSLLPRVQGGEQAAPRDCAAAPAAAGAIMAASRQGRPRRRRGARACAGTRMGQSGGWGRLQRRIQGGGERWQGLWRPLKSSIAAHHTAGWRSTAPNPAPSPQRRGQARVDRRRAPLTGRVDQRCDSPSPPCPSVPFYLPSPPPVEARVPQRHRVSLCPLYDRVLFTPQQVGTALCPWRQGIRLVCLAQFQGPSNCPVL